MNEKLYDELTEIEDRLYEIVNDLGALGTKLGGAWSSLYTYLEEISYNTRS